MAATLEPTAQQTQIPSDVQRKLDKGRARQNQYQPQWAESLAFVEGRHFVFKAKTATGTNLQELETREWGDKDPNRARTVRNRLLGFYLSEVSMGTQRVPSYEVSPANNDPEIINAARLSEKVLLWLYDFLKMRSKLVECYGYSVACGEGFLRPYWDPTKGDALPLECPNCHAPATEAVGTHTVCPQCNTPYTVEQLNEGELCLGAYGPHEVFWEAGVTFDKSGWHAIDTAMSLDEAHALPGFAGPELKADTSGSTSFVQGQLSRGQGNADTVTVTEYLELPSDLHPQGRRFMFANKRQITPSEDYPLSLNGPEGPEPCLVKLPFIPTPWRDRDMGLVEHLVDAQRTLNDCVNKGIEHKNLFIHPMWRAPTSSITGTRISTTAGGVLIYNPTMGDHKPEPIPAPPIPDALFKMADAAISDMEEISSQRGIPSQVESSKAISALLERDNLRRQFIVQALADFHAKVGRQLLAYVQKHFSTPRMLAIQGRHAVDYLPDFRGAQLKDQLAVRVRTTSIEPQTKQGVQSKIQMLVQMFPTFISPEQAILAMESGDAQDLVTDYEEHVAKQQREIQQMIALGTGGPGAQVPVPQRWQNDEIHMQVLDRYLNSEEAEREPPEVQTVMQAHRAAHEQQAAQKRAQQAAEQVQVAQNLGMTNAAKGPSTAMPSLPAPQ